MVPRKVVWGDLFAFDIPCAVSARSAFKRIFAYYQPLNMLTELFS